MIATCCGITIFISSRNNFRRCLVDLFDILIGELLNVIFQLFDLILGYVAAFQLLEGIVCIAADVADCNLRALAFFLYLFGKIFSAVLGKLREYQADAGTVIGGVDADIRNHDGFLDLTDHLFLPGLDHQNPSFRNGDVSHLL